MDIYQRIRQIKQEIEQLQQELQQTRLRKEQTQDPVMQQILQREIGNLIDQIDKTGDKLAKEEAKLPEKRTNGHHPPESKEDFELPINPNVSEEGEESSDN